MDVLMIGCGGISQTHARAISTLAQAHLAGAYDVDSNRARQFVDEYGGRAYNTLEEGLQDTDGAIVASPNFCHHEHALAALEHGRHVLCEKPIATSIAEAEQMVEVANSAASVAAVCFNYRQLPVVRSIRRHIAEGAVGEVLSVDLSFRKDSAFRRKAFTWRDSGKASATSGALGDLGVHLIDLAEYLTGEHHLLDSVGAHRVTVVPEKEGTAVAVDDHAEAFSILSGGTHCRLETSKAAAPQERGVEFKIVGNQGSLHWKSSDGSHLHQGSRAGWDTADLPMPLLADPPSEFYGWADSFRLQLAEWVRACQEGTVGLPGFADGLRAQRVLNKYLERSQPVNLAGA